MIKTHILNKNYFRISNISDYYFTKHEFVNKKGFDRFSHLFDNFSIFF